MKILITGAGGQLARALMASAPPGKVITALSRQELDISDERVVEAVVGQYAPDVIINGAAYTAVDRAEKEGDEAQRINADGPRYLAAAALHHGVRLIHISTDFVFDGNSSKPYTPDSPTHPLSRYGLSKRTGEEQVLRILPDQSVVLRTAWIYAAEGSNFLRTMLRLMGANRAVRVVADQVGTPTAARSVATILWRLVDCPEYSGIHHWTDSGVASWYDFAVAIAEEAAALGMLPSDVSVTPITTEEYPTPARRPAYSVLDKRSLASLGVTPAHWRTNLRAVLGSSPMRSLLVTGGAGFIGSNFVHYWAGQYPSDRVTVLDALTYAGNRGSLERLDGHERLRFVHGDICDRDLVERTLIEERVDTIVHFAAESHVDRSIAAPEVFIRTNVLGTHCLLEAARAVWLGGGAVVPHRFHHVSTDEVYGSLGPDDPAFTESHPYAPNSPYAASKAASDHLVRAYHHTYGLETTLSNCSNNYGPYHFPEKLIPLMIVNILHGRPLPIYGDGRNVRDWLHVSDHCRGIDLVLSGAQPGSAYNIGGRSEAENLHLVKLLCNVADATFAAQPALSERFPACPAARGGSSAQLVAFVKDRPGHDRRYAIDCSHIERDLGFRARIALETGLRDTFLWYLHNEGWWRGVMDGSYRQWVERHYGS